MDIQTAREIVKTIIIILTTIVTVIPLIILLLSIINKTLNYIKGPNRKI